MPLKHRPKRNEPPKSKPPVCNNEEELQIDVDSFMAELFWCKQQLELSISANTNDKKQFEHLTKSHKVLESSTASYIKKRQLMRSLFGDYREKMNKEEKKFKTGNPSLMTNSTQPNSKFVKKSICKPEKENNFDLNSDISSLKISTSDKPCASSAMFKFDFRIPNG